MKQKATARALFVLGRTSNLPTVWTNVFAAWLVSGGAARGAGGGEALFYLQLGATLLYLAGTTLNDVFDVGYDRLYRKERPIPSGLIGEQAALAVGVGYLVAGIIVLVMATGASLVWVGTLAACILIYEVVHKRWAGSVVLMGACRLFLWWLAASAGTAGSGPAVGGAAAVWGGALFAYVVGLSYLARGESEPNRGTGGGSFQFRWPLVLVAAPVLVWIGTVVAGSGHPYIGLNKLSVLYAVSFIAWTTYAVKLLERRGPGRVGQSVSALLSGIVLIDGLAVATHLPNHSGVFLIFLALPATVLLQRKVPAT